MYKHFASSTRPVCPVSRADARRKGRHLRLFVSSWLCSHWPASACKKNKNKKLQPSPVHKPARKGQEKPHPDACLRVCLRAGAETVGNLRFWPPQPAAALKSFIWQG